MERRCSCGKRGQMKYDTIVNRFFDDNERFADIVNGTVGQGKAVVEAGRLTEMDTRTGFHGASSDGKVRYRDVARKHYYGINFMVIGIENQHLTNYLMPLRCMMYDAGEYSRQAAEVRKEVRRRNNITKAEFVSGFTKSDKLCPCVTIVLYYGDNWDGSRSLLELMDFSNIPEELRMAVNDYKIFLVEVKKLTDEQIELFHTDVRQVFQFLRYAGDKQKLKELVEKEPAYWEMQEDAYDMIAVHTRTENLIEKKQYMKGGKVDMGNAILEMVEDGRQEGIEIGIRQGRKLGSEDRCAAIVRNMLLRKMTDSDICAIAECDAEFIKKVRKGMQEKK